MPTSQKQQARTITQLAVYLDQQREVLMREWLARVHSDAAIVSSETLNATQLRDHLPQLLDDLVDLLRAVAQPEPKIPLAAEPAAQRAREGGHTHGYQRWLQGFDLAEVLRELAILRGILIERLLDFKKATPAFDGDQMVATLKLLHRFIDDLIRRSLVSFVEHQQAELREMSASRARLLQTVSHELRIPAGAVALVADSLRLEPDAAELAALATMLDRNIKQMRELLDTLLELSRLVGGHATVKLSPLMPAEVVQELAPVYYGACAAKGLVFEAAVDPALGRVVTDVVKLQQIASNLLHNAVKYTQVGRVSFHLREVDARHWALVVEDTGIGIPASAQPQLFREFFRVPGTEQISGTGLGLAITKHLVELLAGKIRVESEPGKGSCFEVVLPKNV